MGVREDVQDLQATVVEKTTDIFAILKELTSSSSSKAMGVSIPAEVDGIPAISFSFNIDPGHVDFTEDQYTSTLYNALLDVLVRELNTGEYGLDANQWSRIFERARERELELSSAAVDEATQLFASGGFSMPTGAAQAARYRAQKEARDRVAGINRDLLIKEAETLLTAKGQILTASGQLEQTLQTSWASKMDRKLRAAIQDITALVDAAVAEGNVTVARIKAAVDAALGAADLKLKAAIAEAQVLTTIATASMSGLHVNASLGANAGANESFNGSISESKSVNENHNFSE